VTHPERGVMILDRLAEELAELATVEQRPIQDGRNMTMMLGPSKAVLAGQFDAGAASAEAAASDGAGAAAPETAPEGATAPEGQIAPEVATDDGATGAPEAAAEAPDADEAPPAEAPNGKAAAPAEPTPKTSAA
jgi:translation initiation factor IF-3